VKIEIDGALAPRRPKDGKVLERLKFSIAGRDNNDERVSWTDTNEQPLEAKLSSIATEIIIAGELQYRELQIWLCDEAVRRREELKQEAIRRRNELEKTEREPLIKLEAARLAANALAFSSSLWSGSRSRIALRRGSRFSDRIGLRLGLRIANRLGQYRVQLGLRAL